MFVSTPVRSMIQYVLNWPAYRDRVETADRTEVRSPSLFRRSHETASRTGTPDCVFAQLLRMPARAKGESNMVKHRIAAASVANSSDRLRSARAKWQGAGLLSIALI